MLKKVPHKRKLKSALKKLLTLCGVFIGTFLLLFLLYFFTSRNKRIASPLALVSEQINTHTNTQTQIDIIQKKLDKDSIQTLSLTPLIGDATLVTLTSGQEIIFSNSKSIEQQIASLQLIERQLTIEGKRFHRIDFRFDNPVVTF